jgi:hypothetical protein
MNIRAAVFHYPANEIDIGGIVLHKEYFFHCGAPSPPLQLSPVVVVHPRVRRKEKNKLDLADIFSLTFVRRLA